ncbi:MAG TPA: hypothetical protein VKV05_11790 [Terriglobales bacterium]|nr:hypothetical protein [Terriglobales bacterium]
MRRSWREWTLLIAAMLHDSSLHHAEANATDNLSEAIDLTGGGGWTQT